jgi:predicted nucleic acid-binding protein
VSQPGRPQSDRRVFAFGEQLLLPKTVLLDTSFVAEALLSGQTHHAEASAFLSRLADHGTVIRFNRLLELELAEVAFRSAIDEQHGRHRWRKLRHDGRIRRRADRLTRAALEAWRETLDAFTYVLFELEDVIADVPQMMANYGLSSYDAAHAASGLLGESVEAIATLDADFAALPHDITLFTADARVRTMRQHRARHHP